MFDDEEPTTVVDWAPPPYVSAEYARRCAEAGQRLREAAEEARRMRYRPARMGRSA